MPARSAALPVLDRAHQDAVTLGQPDGAAQPARHAQAARSRRRAVTRFGVSPRPSASTRSRSVAVGRNGQDQAAVDAHRVDPEQPASAVDERPAGGSARQRGRVLDRPGDPPPARAPEAAGAGRHEPRRDAQAAPARVGEREHGSGRSAATRVVFGPLDRLDLAGVDVDHRDVEIVVARPARGRLACRPSAKVTVTSSWRRLWAFVSTRPGPITHARTASPAPTEPDHLGTGPLHRGLDRGLDLFKNSHFRPLLLRQVLTCDLQVTRIPPRPAGATAKPCITRQPHWSGSTVTRDACPTCVTRHGASPSASIVAICRFFRARWYGGRPALPSPDARRYRHRAYDQTMTNDSAAVDETETFEAASTRTGLDETSRSALADALATVGDRWTLLVIAALLDGPKRFGELQEEVDGNRAQRPHPAAAPARAQRARRRAPVLRAPAAVRVRAERGGPGACRRPAAARRLGRPERRGRGRTSARGMWDADGGALVVSDVRATGRGRGGRRAPLRLSARDGP